MSRTVWNVFSETAATYPERVAVIDHYGTLTYQQLQMRAKQWAGLVAKHESPGGLVGIMTEHSSDQIAAILGIQGAGCGYIPMEPNFPRERIASMLADGRVKTVITSPDYAHLFGEHIRILCPENISGQAPISEMAALDDENGIAYVLFTSGTTGTPKGVMVTQKNLLHYARAFQQEFQLMPKDRVLQMSVVNFDIYTEEVYPALLNGSCVCVLNPELKDDVTSIVNYCDQVGVTIISSFPYFLQALNRNNRFPKTVRVFISGGDVLHEHYIDKILQKTPVYNTYGPTETTVCASYYRCETGSKFEGNSIPIGHPVQGSKIEILDKQLQPLGPNQIGEICISGSGVSRGYLNRPQETAQSFIPDPTTPGQYRYLSGDMGYQNANGEFMFVCRKDGQVMIQGRRVECLEVETVLNRCPSVIQAAVKAFKDTQGYPHLAAFLKLECGADLSEIKEHLGRYLLEYMMPEHYVLCDDFPMTSSGKLDRKALTLDLSAQLVSAG